ncbi:MAG: S26 family signal peptidase [Candidatus Neomarinimicrobiota bacterium]
MEDLHELLRTATQPLIIATNGNSMLPAIAQGSSLTVLPFSSGINPVRVRDLIVFHSGSRLICHRVLGVFRFGRHVYYYEKGDANRFGWIVSESKLIGKVIAIDGQTVPIDSNSSENPTNRLRILGEILMGMLGWRKGK